MKLIGVILGVSLLILSACSEDKGTTPPANPNPTPTVTLKSDWTVTTLAQEKTTCRNNDSAAFCECLINEVATRVTLAQWQNPNTPAILAELEASEKKCDN